MSARRRRTHVVTLVAAAAALAAALAWFASADRAPTAERGARTIVLITPDTLNRRQVGVYGPPDVPSGTPRLDALAAASLRFVDARTGVPMTLPAHTSMLSGVPPTVHGVRTNAAAPLPPAGHRPHPLLAERLSENGWRCGAFVGAAVLHRTYGLDSGFEHYDDDGLDDLSGLHVRERAGETTVDRALAWLGRLDRDERAFVWVHLFEPHAPYAEDGTYAGGVRHLDAIVGRLLDGLTAGARGDAIVMLVADHGESLGEHGEATHGVLLSDAVLDVPFLLHAPDVAPDTDSRPARVEDVAPTLARLAGCPWPEPASPFHGHDLLGGSSLPPDRHVAESLYANQLHGWAQLVGARDATRSLVDLGEGRWIEAPAGAPFGHAAGDDTTRRLAETIAAYRRIERVAPSAAGDAPTHYGGSGGRATFLDAADNARLPSPFERIDTHARLDAVRAALAATSIPLRALRAAADELARLAAADPRNPEIAFVRARALAALAGSEGENVGGLTAARDAALDAIRLGRRGAPAALVAIDAEARRARAVDGPVAGARAGVDLLDRLHADFGETDCRLLLLRVRLLAEIPGPSAAREREATCREARRRCGPPAHRLIESICGGVDR